MELGNGIKGEPEEARGGMRNITRPMIPRIRRGEDTEDPGCTGFLDATEWARAKLEALEHSPSMHWS